MEQARFRLVAAALAVTVVLGLSGCNGGGGATPRATQSNAAFPVTVTDDSGRDVTITAKPERIVSLAPANTEILAALGLTSKLVGVSTYDDYPAEVKSLPKVGDFTNPNLEAIAGARPDLVLIDDTGGLQADVIAKLEKLGAKVLAIDPPSIEKLYVSIGTVGKATGETDKAATLVRDIKTQVAEVTSKVASATPVTAFIEIAQNPLYTAGTDTLLDDLLTKAGGKNIVAEPGYVAYSLEQLLKQDPEVYLATKGSMNDPLDVVKRPGYDKLRAVKAKRVFALTDNLVSRPGPRIAQGLREFAMRLHPDAFR